MFEKNEVNEKQYIMKYKANSSFHNWSWNF